MSAAASSQPVVDEGSVASRTRRQTRQRARSDDQDEKQSTQSSAHVSPAMRIYRHALESIFAMLQLEDLSRALAVCREWSAAVRSMKAIGATIERNASQLQHEGKLFRPLPPVHSLIASPLLRHLTDLYINDISGYSQTAVTNESLALLAQHAPHLASLYCDLTLTSEAPLAFPASLASLELRLLSELSADMINRVLTALSALPVLRRLALFGLKSVAGVDFSLLSVSHSLDNFKLTDPQDEPPPLSDPQVEQIRRSLGHLHRIDITNMDSDTLRRLLQPPVTARWQDIGSIFADAHTGDLLATLPTLTTLELVYHDDVPHADFLRRLPLLTALDLDLLQRGAALAAGVRSWHIPNEALLTSLLPCTGLTELELACGFKSAHLDTLFKSLTKIKRLKLWCPLDSLRCFASGPITQSLEDLDIYQHYLAPLPVAELDHLYALQRLHSLDLNDCFESRLSDATIDSLCPPTALFPRLTKFACIRSGEPDDCLERTGMSFEWTQQRLTQ